MKIKFPYLVFILLLFCTHAVDAQSYINNQLAPVQAADFTISGEGRATRFRTSAGSGASGIGHIGLHTTDFAPTGLRWNIGLSGVESSGNNGSNFTIWGYGDTGNYLYSAFTIQRSNSYVGIGTAAPTSKLHVNGVQGAVIGKFTQSNIPSSDGYLNIQNGTSGSGYFIPTIVGRAYVPGKPSGLYLIGEADDFVPVGSDTNYAAVMIDGRTKTGTRPANNNVFAVNTVGKNLLMVKADGSVGIGTTDTKGYKLAVNGSGIFTKVKVKSYNNWPDYVFDENFTLPSLEEVNQYIRKNKRLPDMPAASEVEREGIDLGEINRKLVQKVEEQMLYIIRMNEDMQQLKERIKSLENQSK